MKNKLKNLAKNFRLVLITALVLILLALMLIKPSFRQEKSFEIEDKCGKFVNLVSHTVEDESACRSRCTAQCVSIEHKYSKSEFKKSSAGCNSCICSCK